MSSGRTPEHTFDSDTFGATPAESTLPQRALLRRAVSDGPLRGGRTTPASCEVFDYLECWNMEDVCC